ncbi:MAG: DUF2157 domain-containing protein [Bacteroidales bacterium]|nr:DUF2157 domain-containing protein [Bacteroidales bacterium]
MKILKEIPELLDAGIISQDTADKINDYFLKKSRRSPNRLFLVFGLLGAILVGLGVILIVAHNWDELSRLNKTIFSFLPMFAGQLLCAFVLIRKADNQVWKESSTAFLFLAIGATISLVSQVYHIPGNLGSFLFTWMLIGLPLIYVMNSSVASMFYLTGITWYACETGYFTYPASEPYFFWLLLLLALPHYYLLYRRDPGSNFFTFHSLLIPLSVVITLGTLAKNDENLMFISYISLFGLLFMIGNMSPMTRLKQRSNGYSVLGSLGTISLLLFLSFDWFWRSLRIDGFFLRASVTSPEFITAVMISFCAGALFYLQMKTRKWNEMNPVMPVFIIFILTYIAGIFTPYAVVLINLIILAIGVITIRNGAKSDHLGILNYGVLIITALVICRFFDTDLSFVLRGGMFVLVGAGFFALNFWMLRKRRGND